MMGTGGIGGPGGIGKGLAIVGGSIPGGGGGGGGRLGSPGTGSVGLISGGGGIRSNDVPSGCIACTIGCLGGGGGGGSLGGGNEVNFEKSFVAADSDFPDSGI